MSGPEQRSRWWRSLCRASGRRLLPWAGSVCAAGWLVASSVLTPNLSAEEAAASRPTARRSEAKARADRPSAELARNPLDDIKHWVDRVASQREVSQRQRDHESIRAAFRDAVMPARSATVRVLADDVPVAYGAIVSKDGFVITKASELRGALTCQLSDKRKLAAEVVQTKPEHDLALLKVTSEEPLAVVEWNRDPQVVGNFLATVGQDELPTAIGVVSVAPRRIAAAIGFLGVGLEQQRPRVTHVAPGSAADKAGIEVNDLVTKIDGQAIDTREGLQAHIRKHSPGETIELTVRRGDSEFKIAAVLGDAATGLQSERAEVQNRLGGSVSTRRAGFESVVQHDTVLHPSECGGPIVDLDGKVVGINIARAGRVASYALPTSVVAPLVERLLDEQRGASVAAGQTKEPMTMKVGG